MEEDNIYTEAVNTFGILEQIERFILRMGNLLISLQNSKFEHNDFNDVVDKIADLEISLNQLKAIYVLNNDFYERVFLSKLKQLKDQVLIGNLIEKKELN